MIISVHTCTVHVIRKTGVMGVSPDDACCRRVARRVVVAARGLKQISNGYTFVVVFSFVLVKYLHVVVNTYM